MESSVVISLGGSVISDDPVDVKLIKKYSRILSMIKQKKIAIVVGGGQVARSYITSLRKEKASEYLLDQVGILATRLNALSAASLIEDASRRVPETVEEAMDLLDTHRVIVMGGTTPGHTTDTVAALLAERMKCGILVNATSVDGVYDSDPRKNSSAKRIARLSYDQALELSMKESAGAGSNVFMDPVSLTIARRSSTKIYVIDGRKPEQIETILSEGKCEGSLIS